MRPGTRREKQRRERGKTRLLSDFLPPSVPSPDSEHQNCRHTQELGLRKRNLSAINSVQAIYLPSSDRRNCHRLFFFPFLISRYLIWLSFWVFWLDRYRFRYLLWCLGFSVTVCRFQILMLFVWFFPSCPNSLFLSCFPSLFLSQESCDCICFVICYFSLKSITQGIIQFV